MRGPASADGVAIREDALVELIGGDPHVLWVLNVDRLSLYLLEVRLECLIFARAPNELPFKLSVDLGLVQRQDLRFGLGLLSEIALGVNLLELLALVGLLDKLEVPVLEALVVGKVVGLGPGVHFSEIN